MGCCRKTFIGLFILSGAILAGLFALINQSGPSLEIPETGYWGPQKVPAGAKPPKDDEKIYPFTVTYDDKLIATLKEELARTKYVEPLEDAKYHYGINLKTFRNVIEYWRTKFDFKKAQNDLNAFPNFKTQIEGLRIHFYRSTPKVSANVKVYPLLLVHGWPGSVVEFLKLTALLSKPVEGVAFDVVVPSIPGYGFSDASSKQGFELTATARIFRKLMERLGHSKFFMQGGDWGAGVTGAMARLYPDSLYGAHFNLILMAGTPRVILKNIAWNYFPSVFGDDKHPPCMMYPFSKRAIDMLRESGYTHLQSTKPDTIGFTLLNSPAGLAGYILEKFSTWTQDDFRELEDGGLTKKFSLDDLLANIMVYYSTNTIISSQRYYKENILSNASTNIHTRKITVPVGYTVFPNEIFCQPRFIVEEFFSNLVTMTYQEDGGHFAAFEQPKLLETDFRAFVKEVDKKFLTKSQKQSN